MREILFKKVLIKSITLLFSVLVWGQPALGCDDWGGSRPQDLKPEIERVYSDDNPNLVPVVFMGESTPLSVVSLRLDPHKAYHDPAEPDGSLSPPRLRSVPER